MSLDLSQNGGRIEFPVGNDGLVVLVACSNFSYFLVFKPSSILHCLTSLFPNTNPCFMKLVSYRRDFIIQTSAIIVKLSMVAVFLFDRCNVVVNILENAHKVAATETTCDDCQSAIVEVQFKVIGSFVTFFHFFTCIIVFHCYLWDWPNVWMRQFILRYA